VTQPVHRPRQRPERGNETYTDELRLLFDALSTLHQVMRCSYAPARYIVMRQRRDIHFPFHSTSQFWTSIGGTA
jgi:hypothetical protein